MDNVLKACAKEYLNIDDNDYEYEVARQKLELFLLDGKAVVKDPSYTFNKTSFNFVYIKVPRSHFFICLLLQIEDMYQWSDTKPALIYKISGLVVRQYRDKKVNAL